MSKHKKDNTPLKFDTSSANIGCFIRPKSKSKNEHDRFSPYPARRKHRHDREKQLEFQDKAFLESVVCRILNDADCEGITDLIEEMVFPGSCNEADHRDSNCEYFEQQEISQIFSNSLAPQSSIYPPTQHIYRIVPPIEQAKR